MIDCISNKTRKLISQDLLSEWRVAFSMVIGRGLIPLHGEIESTFLSGK